MTGPGPLRGSAAVEQYDPVAYALFQQEESQQFQEEQAQRYEAHCTRTSLGEFTVNSVRNGYEEQSYQFPGGECRDNA